MRIKCSLPLVGETLDIIDMADPGRESITEPGRDMAKVASDMARGSSIWFCSTTCNKRVFIDAIPSLLVTLSLRQSRKVRVYKLKIIVLRLIHIIQRSFSTDASIDGEALLVLSTLRVWGIYIHIHVYILYYDLILPPRRKQNDVIIRRSCLGIRISNV